MAPRVTFNGGTIGGGNANSQLIFNGGLDWLGSGSLGGLGIINIAGSSTWSGGTKSLTIASTQLQNSGTLTLSEGALRANSSNTPGVTNLAGGEFNIAFDGVALQDNFIGRFDNQAGATFAKTAGTGTSTVQWLFNNAGTVRIDIGTLNFTGAFTQSGANSVIDLAGGNLTSSGALLLTDGALTGSGSVTANVIGGGQGFDTTPGGGLIGQIDITGDLDLSGADSNVFFQIGGFDPGSGFDRLNVSGTATLTGAELDIAMLNGFENALTGSETFTILSAVGGLNGTVFANAADGFRLATSDGIGSFVVTYTANSVQLGQFVNNNPIPEPRWLALLLPMLAGLARLCRRRALSAV